MRDGHVSLWHPWQDKPGRSHKLALLQDMTFNNIDSLVETIGGNQYYALVENILDGLEINPLLLRDKRTETYLTRSGHAIALRVRSKRKSGFILPSQTWGDIYPKNETLDRMAYIFDRFGYEAITPASLSEKVLRSTMQEKLIISRPNAILRSTLLKYGKGARISSKKTHKALPVAYENDSNKEYLFESTQGVPSPFISPIRFYGDKSGWYSGKTSWCHVNMTCHRSKETQPIQIHDNGEMRECRDGEEIDTWLWREEIEDCLSVGYSLNNVLEGWFWDEISFFMSGWADILYSKYSQETDESIKDIEKIMMVGLPGRFLKAPEKITLIHKSEARGTDLPLLAHDWKKNGSPMSEWCMRVEEDMDSSQLTPIGSYIIMKCRQKIFHDIHREEQAGNTVARIYVDSFTTTQKPTTIAIGKERGQYKVKVYTEVYIRNNQFIGKIDGKWILKAPAYNLSDTEAREKISRELRSISPCNSS